MRPLSLDAEELRIFEVFFPYALKEMLRARLMSPPTCFVHYSSADTAMKMLDSAEMWMRKAAAMNDFREIEYGRECLAEAWVGAQGDRFKALLDGMFPDFSKKMEPHFFGEWYPRLLSNTFVSCFSEHDAAEDDNGRLSMWRAYGGNAGVAIILEGEMFLSRSDALKAYTSPVAYLTPAGFSAEFGKVVDQMEMNAEFVSALGEQRVSGLILAAFRAAVTCTKHPGFLEEKEWRIVYTPEWDGSKRIVEDVVTINGVPQVIQKIPLTDVPEEGLIGIEMPKLLRRVIVGPSAFPFEIREALIKKLEQKGVENAARKVFVSNIPLRRIG